LIIHQGKTPCNLTNRKLLVISTFYLDKTLHKTSDLEILLQLAKRGYTPCLMAMRSRSIPQLNKNFHVRIFLIPLRDKPIISQVMYTLILFFFLPVYIVLLKPEFIIMLPNFCILSSIASLILSKFTKVKFILDVRSTPVEISGFRGCLQSFAFTISVLLAKKFFAGMTIITSPMKKEICKKYKINPDKIGVWTSGVSTTLFDPRNYISEGAKLKTKFGLSKKFVIFYHGSFSATRGLVETIDAINVLRDTYPDVVLFLLGSGPIISELKDLVQKESLQGNVIIHNPVDYAEVPKFVEMSDLCITPLPNHPYWRFQCPLKLLEYLAMEKVVIATDIPAHRSVIGKEKCGLYISSIKPTEIAKSIVYAYHNKDKLKEWGKSGRTIVTEKYTWEKVANDLENYLLSIDN